jgi:transcriptional antiterminator NusG
MMDVQEPEDRSEERPVDEMDTVETTGELEAPQSVSASESEPAAQADDSTPPDLSSTEAEASDDDSEPAREEPPVETPVAAQPEPAADEPEVQTDESESIEAPAAHVEVAPIREPAPPATDATPPDLPAGDAPEGPAWYVVHCYSGYENKVRHNLEQRIETMGMKDKIFDVVIPTQEEIEVKEGKRRTVERHIFPGYVLVNMVLSEESWYVVRNTPGVTGFVGMGNQPTPLRPEEVSQIIKRMEADAPTVKVTFKVGERVRIIDGPFNDFRGVVAEIDMERTKVRVMVSFFGRETPVELDFLQVEKA